MLCAACFKNTACIITQYYIDNANIEKVIFNIENINLETKYYSYSDSDVNDHILQIKDRIMAIDVSFASAIDFKAEMLSDSIEKVGMTHIVLRRIKK